MSRVIDEIQNEFLGSLQRDRKTAWIFLVNGIKLTGVIETFDKYVIALQSPTGTQTIYKSAVSTVSEAHGLPTRKTEEHPPMPHNKRPAGGRLH